MSTRSLLAWFALVAGLEFAVRGHLEDDALRHGVGLALFAIGAVAVSRGTRLGRWGIGVALAVAGLVVVDTGLAVLRPEPDPAAATWSFARADGDPRAYASWYAAQAPTWRFLAAPPNPDSGRTPIVFDHEIALNPLGLRGAEPARAAGRYRIVVLGGATAFDATRADESSWPEQLEVAIRDTYDCAKPVDVVNGGRPGEPLGGGALALGRYADSFAPDLVLVYPGPRILDALLAERPELRFDAPEPTPARSSLLGSFLERRWVAARTDRRWRAALAGTEPGDAPASPTAARYRSLLVEARTRGVDGVATTPALAVSEASSEAALRFYEGAEPRTRSRIRARRVHDRIVRAVAASYGVRVIETGAALDRGDVESFRTVTQLAPAGRKRLVAVLLAGLSNELSRPAPGCALRTRRAPAS